MIKPFSNGQKYGWSKLRSLFDFFLPYAKNGDYEFIRAEALSTSEGYKEFYTFRAFFFHYSYSFIDLFTKAPLEFAKSLQIKSQFAYQIGAIALDVADNSGQKTASPYTFNHTCTGSNGMLSLSSNLDGTTGGGQPTVSAATYNSVSMVKAVGKQQIGTFNDVEASIWLLMSPSTGSNIISVTVTNIKDCGGTAISYSGVSQTNTPDSTGGTSGTTSGAKTASITTVADNSWIIATGVGDGSTPTMTSPTYTSRSNFALNTGGVTNGINAVQDTNGAITPAGAQTIGWTFNLSGFPVFALATASIAPAVGTTGSLLPMFRP